MEGFDVGDSAVRRETFCQRFGGSCACAVFGVVLFFGSVAMLGWNEFNYVANEQVLSLVEHRVVRGACTPDPRNDGKPVWTSCVVQKAWDFAVDPDAPRFLRTDHHKANSAWIQVRTKIYQWVETFQEKSHKTPSGDKITERFYKYDRQWVDAPQDSSEFYCVRHRDPVHCPASATAANLSNVGEIPRVMRGRKQFAPDNGVGIGDFPPIDAQMYYLPQGLLSQITRSRPAEIDTLAPSPIPGKKVYDKGSGRVLLADTQAKTTVGDVSATLALADVTPGTSRLSVIALQQGATVGRGFAIWHTGLSGTMASVAWLSEGGKSKQQMIAQKHSDNSGLTMLLRVVGWAAMFAGLQLVTGPLSTAPEMLPFVGGLFGEVVGCGLCVINFCVASAISLLVIGVAWIAARPLLGLLLLAAACGAVCAGRHLLRRKRPARAEVVGYPAAASAPLRHA